MIEWEYPRVLEVHMGSDPLVIHTEVFSEDARSWLAERAELLACKPGEPLFEERAADAAGLLVRTYTQVNDALLDQMPALQVVGRAGVGIDNIDVPACRKRGVEVVYTPDANTQAVAEYVIALICDSMRPRIQLQEPGELTEWSTMRKTYRAQRQLDECTVGILGLGRIGKRLARILEAIGCRVLFNDLLEMDEAVCSGAQSVSLEALFEQSNIVTIHIDGAPSNRHWVNERVLRLLPQDAIVINTSRGFVLNHDDLFAHLHANPQTQAYLDVHDPEPPHPDNPLFTLPNAFLYPHLASRTETGMRRMSDVVQDMWAVIQGNPPKYPAPQ